MVMRESIYYINLRQAYLLSPLYANRMSSRTVLFSSVPKEYRDEAKLRRLFGHRLVKNIWIVKDCKEIENLVELRDKVAMRLERAETKLVRLANKNHLKVAEKGSGRPQTLNYADEAGNSDDSGSLAARWVRAKARPTHRLKPIIGKKVDTINWCRSKLQQLLPEVEALQDQMRVGDGKFICSVFVEFYSQSEAQMAYQNLAHHLPLHMTPKFIGVSPEEVVWRNLSIDWASRIIRDIIMTGIATALVIFWAVPVAFIGALSNIEALSSGNPNSNPPIPPLLPWLSFINNIPSQILGVVQGLIPSLLLSALMSLLSIFLRLMAKHAGKPSLASVELRVQNVFFVFQVIQVFLITTLSSAASAAAVEVIRDPTSALTILSRDIPKASNFYISYFILQGLAISSGEVLQAMGIILYRISGVIFDSTPRKMYNRFAELDGLEWGTVFPVYTLLTVIAITYSIIAPLVLGFATVGLYLIYLAYRYNLLFVFNADIDTKGRVYPRALQQTLTGVYLAIVCLVGLFAVAKAWGPLILMVIFVIFAILFHISLNRAIDPLLNFLPKSLQSEEESLLLEDGINPAVGNNDISNTKESSVSHTSTTSTENGTLVAAASSQRKPPSFFAKWLAPHKYTDYYTLRRQVPHNLIDISYDPETERDAYHHPAISSPIPTLWIPKDAMGVSEQECRHTSRVIPMTDEGAGFDRKGRIVWDRENGRPPVYEEKVYY